jgi:hypothetical protein
MSNERSSSSWLLYALLVLAGSALPLLVGWSHLPEPVATHWPRGGAPDGSGSKLGVIFMLSAIGLSPLLALRAKSADALRSATALATLVFMGLVTTGVSLVVTIANWDRSTWTEARLPGVALLLLLGLPSAAAGITYWVARRLYPVVRVDPSELPSLSLAPGERAYWTGSAHNPWFWLLALAIGGLAWVTGPQSGALAVLGPALALLVLALLARIRVTVNERGLEVRYGVLGLPRQRIPLARIRSAEAFDLVPLAHGGWGYRGSLRALGSASIVVRGGLALRLELEENKRLCITVDGADDAAKLLNGFVARRAATKPNV